MKLFIQLILFCPALVFCQEIAEFEAVKPIKITGSIANPTTQTVNIIALELMGRKNYLAKLDSNGQFSIQIQNLTAHNNYLKYDKDLIQFFAEPGDIIHLEADARSFKASARFTGDNEAFNKSLKPFGTKLGQNIEKFQLFTQKREAAPEEYQRVMGEFFDQMQSDIDSIGVSLRSDQVAIDWMKARVKYWIYDELFEYGKRHKKEIQQPNNGETSTSYYDFASRCEGSVLADLMCSRFYESFVSGYYEQKLWGPLQSYQELIDSGQYYNGYKLAVEIHQELVDDLLSRELLITRTLYDLLDQGIRPQEKIVDLFYQSVETVIFREIIYHKLASTKPSNQSKTLQDLSQLEYAGIVFKEIEKYHRGKVLYIDFWGTWCGPCIKEFPASRKLYESLDKDLVEFVYLGVRSQKETWEKGIEKHGLRGTHFLLTIDQYMELREFFNIDGIPRYVILDQLGKVVDEDATRLRDHKLKKKLVTLSNEG